MLSGTVAAAASAVVADPIPPNVPIRFLPRNPLAFLPVARPFPRRSLSTSVVAQSGASVALASPSPNSLLLPSQDRVSVLSEALPFIQRFHKKTVVVKYGGSAMKDPHLKDSVIKDLVLLSCVGINPVCVHGGGPEINEWLKKLNIEPKFEGGLRVTDAATMEIVEMVLVGKVNKSLVSMVNTAGGTGVGLCGKDGKLLTARPAGGSLGFVGEISSVDTSILNKIVETGAIPIVATVAADQGGQGYNINADTAAGAIAASLGAEKLILITDVPGIMLDVNDPKSLIKEIDIKGMRKLIADGKVSGGMIPKVQCCIQSLSQGVRTASIIDGRLPHSLLLEILTGEGAGTMIVG